jgi:hypothetical protein
MKKKIIKTKNEKRIQDKKELKPKKKKKKKKGRMLTSTSGASLH